jgi:hypothetical protein
MARGEGSYADDLSGSVIIPVGAIARALRWTPTRTKRWLRKDGILRKQQCGTYGRCYTTAALLRSAYPETADHILAGLEDE